MVFYSQIFFRRQFSHLAETLMGVTVSLASVYNWISVIRDVSSLSSRAKFCRVLAIVANNTGDVSESTNLAEVRSPGSLRSLRSLRSLGGANGCIINLTVELDSEIILVTIFNAIWFCLAIDESQLCLPLEYRYGFIGIHILRYIMCVYIILYLCRV